MGIALPPLPRQLLPGKAEAAGAGMKLLLKLTAKQKGRPYYVKTNRITNAYTTGMPVTISIFLRVSFLRIMQCCFLFEYILPEVVFQAKPNNCY
jgi:hypothetical protein